MGEGKRKQVKPRATKTDAKAKNNIYDGIECPIMMV